MLKPAKRRSKRKRAIRILKWIERKKGKTGISLPEVSNRLYISKHKLKEMPETRGGKPILSKNTIREMEASTMRPYKKVLPKAYLKRGSVVEKKKAARSELRRLILRSRDLKKNLQVPSFETRVDEFIKNIGTKGLEFYLKVAEEEKKRLEKRRDHWAAVQYNGLVLFRKHAQTHIIAKKSTREL